MVEYGGVDVEEVVHGLSDEGVDLGSLFRGISMVFWRRPPP